MHDYGAEGVKDAVAAGQRVRWSLWAYAASSALQAAAGLFCALGGARGASLQSELIGFFGLSYLVSVVSVVCLVLWMRACYQALAGLQIRSSLPVGPWVLLFLGLCVPCVGGFVVLGVLLDLARLIDPARLPPVVEEREVRDGGFRDNAVVKVATGEVSAPRVWLVFAFWIGSNGILSVNNALQLTQAHALTMAGAVAVAAALLASRMVRALDRNLVELHRRMGESAA